MNIETILKLKDDDFLKPKIILLIIYVLLFTLSIVVTDGSVVELLQQLLLQVGKAISSPTPVQVSS